MIKIVNKIENANCITHSGTMHADDVFATAFLELYLKEIQVFRASSIDQKDQGKEIYIYDIGRGKFDHHQEDAQKRSNGISYSSIGLLWKEYGKDYLHREQIQNSEEVYEEVDKNLIEGIDAIDNGIFPKIEANYKVKTICDVIKLFNPSYQSQQEESIQFLKAVNVAKEIFLEEIKTEEGKIKAKKQVLEKLSKIKNHTLILEEFMPYEETILKEKEGQEIAFVIYPSNRGGYAIKTVPKSMEDKTKKVEFPEEWAGLEKEELEKISGIKGIEFCHRGRFLVTCKTKEIAQKIVEVVLKKEQKEQDQVV